MSQVGWVDLSDIGSINKYGPLFRLVKPNKEALKCTLAAANAPDYPDFFASIDRKRDFVERRCILTWIGKSDILERDLPTEIGPTYKRLSVRAVDGRAHEHIKCRERCTGLVETRQNSGDL